MESPATQTLIADLARAFPRQKIDRETVRVYLRELADIPPALLERAVRDLIRTSEWFPTVAAIRQQAAEDAFALPTESLALAQVEERIRWARGDKQGDPPPVHPMVKEALERVGGYHAFRTADEPAVLRGQFGRLYRDMRASALRVGQSGTLAINPTREGATDVIDVYRGSPRERSAQGDKAGP